MSITLKPGMRLFGAACKTEAIVVKCPPVPVDVRIGGLPPLLDVFARSDDAQPVPSDDAPASMGKRYVDATGTVELLCTKAGSGSFAVGDVVCEIKDAKPLPASD